MSDIHLVDGKDVEKLKGSSKTQIKNEFKDDYFKIDPECHLPGNMDAIEYFPGVKLWWKSIQNIIRAMGILLERTAGWLSKGKLRLVAIIGELNGTRAVLA